MRVLRVNKTVWSLDCRMMATPRSTPRLVGSSVPGGLGCWSRAAKGQKGGRWWEGATRVRASEAGRAFKNGDAARRGRGRVGAAGPAPGFSSRPQAAPAAARPARRGPAPDLERKPGRGAREWPVRQEELSRLPAAVRGPRPGPGPRAQEATHTLREAHRLRAPGQEQQHARRGHNVALSLRPARRPLAAQRRRPSVCAVGGKPGFPSVPGSPGLTRGDEP